LIGGYNEMLEKYPNAVDSILNNRTNRFTVYQLYILHYIWTVSLILEFFVELIVPPML